MRLSIRVSLSLVLLVTSFVSHTGFPSHAAPDAEKPPVVSATAPTYPPLAKAALISGDVPVEVSIDAAGNVTSARAESGHPLLREASEAAAKRWKFAPAASEPTVRRVLLTFTYEPYRRRSAPAGISAVFLPPYKVSIVMEIGALQTDATR
jgi:TonB family protein